MLGRKEENLPPTHPFLLRKINLSPRTSNNSTFFRHQWCSTYGNFSRILMILFYKQNEKNYNSIHLELRRLLTCKMLEGTIRNCPLRTLREKNPKIIQNAQLQCPLIRRCKSLTTSPWVPFSASVRAVHLILLKF